MDFDFSNTTDVDVFVSQAADASFKILTGKVVMSEMYDSNDRFIALFFDPFSTKLDGITVIEDLVRFYEETENYEYCSELVKLKSTIGNGREWILDLLWRE